MKKKRQIKKKINWKVLIWSLIIVFIVAGIGGFFTGKNVNSQWYSQVKPSITPPGWVFPVVWNTLFVLIAYSLYFTWTRSNKKQKLKIGILFGINFALNILWSILFFTMQNPFAAFIEIIFLWLSIFVLMIEAWEIKKAAGYLLIPYFLWVSFAVYLNWLAHINSLLFG